MLDTKAISPGAIAIVSDEVWLLMCLGCREAIIMISFLKLSLLLPEEEKNITQQKTCLLMAAGSELQVCRDLKDEDEKVGFYF